MTETLQTELINSNASPKCLFGYKTVTTCSNNEAVSTVTECLAYSSIPKMYSHATSSENGPSSKSQTHGSHATSSENGPSSKSQTHGSHATSSENGPSSKSQTHGSHATSSENGPSSKSQTHGSHATSSENGPSSKSQTHGIFALHGRKKYGPLPNTENGRILRKGNSLSTNDLEEDTISAISCKQAVLKDAPDCIPQCLLSLPSKVCRLLHG